MQAEHDHRVDPPAHATGAVAFVSLADIAGDRTFSVRSEGDVSLLATSMGRLGQLVPIELRPVALPREGSPRWQVVAGFRRLAAVRLLARERVLARLHRHLSDEDAWGLALGEALLHQALTLSELEALRERLRASGDAPWADELLDGALVRAAPAIEAPPSPQPSPPAGDADTVGGPVAAAEPAPPALPDVPGAAPAAFPPDDVVEVTPEELVQDLAARLYALNQDLATAFEAWEDLPVDGRRLLVEQARYVVDLLPFMEAKG